MPPAGTALPFRPSQLAVIALPPESSSPVIILSGDICATPSVCGRNCFRPERSQQGRALYCCCVACATFLFILRRAPDSRSPHKGRWCSFPTHATECFLQPDARSYGNTLKATTTTSEKGERDHQRVTHESDDMPPCLDTWLCTCCVFRSLLNIIRHSPVPPPPLSRCNSCVPHHQWFWAGHRNR